MSIDEFNARLRDGDGPMFEILRGLAKLSVARISSSPFRHWNPWPKPALEEPSEL